MDCRILRHVTLKAFWRLLLMGREVGEATWPVTLIAGGCAVAVVALVVAAIRRVRRAAGGQGRQGEAGQGSADERPREETETSASHRQSRSPISDPPSQPELLAASLSSPSSSFLELLSMYTVN